MQLLPLIGLVVLLGILALLLRRSQVRRAAQRAELAKQARAKAQQAAAAKLPRRAWFGRRRPMVDPLAPVRLWLQGATVDQTAIQEWLNKLSSAELQALVDELSTFCQTLAIDFVWLVEKQVDANPSLAQSLTQIVLHYVSARCEAAAVQVDIQGFRAWQLFRQDPQPEEQQLFARRFFAELLEQQVIPPISGQFFTAPEAEQSAYIVTAIREAAERQPAAFFAALRSVMLKPATLPTAPAPEPQSRRWFRRSPNTTAKLTSVATPS